SEAKGSREVRRGSILTPLGVRVRNEVTSSVATLIEKRVAYFIAIRVSYLWIHVVAAIVLHTWIVYIQVAIWKRRTTGLCTVIRAFVKRVHDLEQRLNRATCRRTGNSE